MLHKPTLALALSYVLSAHAEELPVTLADEIVVTATRSPQKLSETLADVTVLTRDEIEASGALDLPALLEGLPGVEISQNGGFGAASAIRLRGAESDHTLVLVDGMRMSSASTGTTAIEHILLDSVERIEIVRGNVSSLYGSEAIGGVVQIFTRQGKGEMSLSATVGAGTDDYCKLAASVGGALSSDTRLNLGFVNAQSGGFSAVREQYIPTPGLFSAADADNDRGQNLSANFNLEHSLDSALRVGITALHSRADVEYDGVSANHEDQTLAGYSLYLDADPGLQWHTRLTVGHSEDALQTDLSGAPAGFFNTDTDQLNWENQLQTGAHSSFRFGAEALRQNLASDSDYSATRRDTASIYAGYGWHKGLHQLDVSTRYDHYSDSGDHVTGRLAYGYQLTPSLKFHGALATAFKAPTFNDLYLNYPPFYFANPNLKPEQANSAELGLSYGERDQFAQATLFATRTRDMIAIDPVTFATTVNLNRAQNLGLELSWQGYLAGLASRVAYTLQNPVDEATGLGLLRRSRQFGSFSLSDHRTKLGWHAELLAAASHPDVDIANFARTQVAGYAVLNLTADYAVKKNWRLSASLINAGDVDYSLVQGYNTPGRQLRLELAYQPK